MPRRAGRPCPVVVRGRPCAHLRPCPRHPRGERPDRGSATAQGYGSAWEALRRAVIAERGGVCEDCGQPGTPEDPLDVDHVLAKRKGGTDDRSNLRVRHHSEHSRKTVRVDGALRRRTDPEES